MFYDTASGCFIEVTQVGDILLIDITDCGDLSGGGIGLPANFGGGNFGPWVVYDPNGDGICKARRGYTNMDGMPDYQELNFPVPCNENFDPNYGDNNDNSSDLPWDNNDDTGNNSDPLHDGGGGQSNNSDTISNNIVTTIGVIKDEKSADQIVIDCVGATNLTSSQSSWLSSNPIIAKKMASMIVKSRCFVMAPIILEFLEDTSHNLEEFVENELECYGVQTLTDNTDFMDAIDDLKEFIEDIDEENEQGFEVSNIDGTISTNFVPGQHDKVILNHGGNIIGGMHLHPDQGDKMFSAEDIFKLYAYYQSTAIEQNPNVSYHDVFSILTTENGTYMIKINDFNIFRAIINQLDPTDFYGMKRFNQKFSYRKNATSTQFERKFLKSLSKLEEEFNLPKTPIKLFKLNTTTNAFEKLILISEQPETVPCN